MKRRLRTGCFNLSYHTGISSYIIGFAARATLGHAVERNRVKRIIRDAWRKNFEAGDFFFILRPPAMKISGEELRKALEETAHRVKEKQ